MEENTHQGIIPSKKIVNKIKKKKSIKIVKGDPQFYMNEDIKRLSTPWSIASTRAKQIDVSKLPPGVILDPAAGSGVQLLAYSKELKRPSLGIELEKDIAEVCAANMEINSEEGVHRSLDRVLIGDGTDAENAVTSYWSSLRENGNKAQPPIAMLHLDPARPRDAQNHSIEEMKPDIRLILKNWSKFLQKGPKGPAVILDLSPRLDSIQRAAVDGILETSFPGSPRTWEWLSQGGGRVDRLSVWLGAISSKQDRRCIRMGRKKIISMLEGSANEIPNIISFNKPPDFGAWISIVDPTLFHSGLHDVWLKNAVTPETGCNWIRTEGRRPLLIHTDPLRDVDEVQGFVVASGKIIQHRLTPPEIHTIDLVADSVSGKGIGKITLRCSLNPEIHPTLQRRLDKALKEKKGDRAFMVDMEIFRGGQKQDLFVVCKER